MTMCVGCSAKYPDLGERGVCPSCKQKYPAFIPKDKLSRDAAVLPDSVYRFQARGAVRYDRSAAAVEKGDRPRRGWRPLYNPFPAQTPRKRTPEERVDSLHMRLVDCITKLGGIPDSMLQLVQREQIAQGKEPMTSDQLRHLAQFFMERARAEHEAQQRKQVVRS